LWSGSKTVLLGLGWGLGQVFFLVILFAGGLAQTSDVVLPSLVVFGFAIVVGYALSDLRDNVAALILSITMTFSSFYLLTVLGDPFTSFTALTSDDLRRIFAFYPIAFFIVGIGGSFAGMVLSGRISQIDSKHTLHLSPHRIVLLALFLATLSLGSSLLVQFQFARLERTINLENARVVKETILAWKTGTENISANFGPVQKGAGVLEVSYLSTGCITYYVVILDSLVTLKKGPGVGCQYGGARIPFVSSPLLGETSQNFTAWFHNDDCSTSGCPSGSMIYKVTIYN
jgi:hypothetical protein